MVFTVKKKDLPEWAAEKLREKGFQESELGFAKNLNDLGRKPKSTARPINIYKPCRIEAKQHSLVC